MTMTDPINEITRQDNEITRLHGVIASLLSEIEDYKKQLEDAESSFESLYEAREKIELETTDYMQNKSFFDEIMNNFVDIKEFFNYVKDDCEVKPQNEHIYRAYFNGMKRVLSTIKGV